MSGNTAPVGTWRQAPLREAPEKRFYDPLKPLIESLAATGCYIFHAARTVTPMAASIANPYLEGGGLAGYSRSHIFSLFTSQEGKDLLPRWISVRASADKGQREADTFKCQGKAALAYPLVARPDLEGDETGIRLIEDEEQLRLYSASFPQGERFILQQIAKPSFIAHLYYRRQPDDDIGRIVSLAFSYFPTVSGDGVQTVQELVLAHPLWSAQAATYLGSCAGDWNFVVPEGEEYRLTPIGTSLKHMAHEDACAQITSAMNAYWDRILRGLPEFYCGRIDLGLSDPKDLETGKNVTILSISGAGTNYPHLKDPHAPFIDVLRGINDTIGNLFDIGVMNKKRGHVPESPVYILGMWLKQKALRKRYPL